MTAHVKAVSPELLSLIEVERLQTLPSYPTDTGLR